MIIPQLPLQPMPTDYLQTTISLTLLLATVLGFLFFYWLLHGGSNDHLPRDEKLGLN